MRFRHRLRRLLPLVQLHCQRLVKIALHWLALIGVVPVDHQGIHPTIDYPCLVIHKPLRLSLLLYAKRRDILGPRPRVRPRPAGPLPHRRVLTTHTHHTPSSPPTLTTPRPHQSRNALARERSSLQGKRARDRAAPAA